VSVVYSISAENLPTAPPHLGYRPNLAGGHRWHCDRPAGLCVPRSGRAKNPWPLGKTVLAQDTGGDDSPAAAKVLAVAAGTAEGTGGVSSLASGGDTGGQRKVTSLCWPGGHPLCSGVNAGLEAAGRNRISPATYLEPEEVTAPGQHTVGAVVQWLQWQQVAVVADYDHLGIQEVSRKILSVPLGPSHVVPGRKDFGSTHSLRKQLVCQKQPERERCCHPIVGQHGGPAEPRGGAQSTRGHLGRPTGLP
jgi:hypothetical protein